MNKIKLDLKNSKWWEPGMGNIFQSVLNIELTNTYVMPSPNEQSLVNAIQVRGASAQQQSPSIAELAGIRELEQDQSNFQVKNVNLLDSKNKSNAALAALQAIPDENNDFLQNLNFDEISPNFGDFAGNDLAYPNIFDASMADVSKKIFENRVFDLNEIMVDDDNDDEQDGVKANKREDKSKKQLEKLLLGSDARLDGKSNKFKN